MEYCDTSLAKRIQDQVATLQLNHWAESVRYLMDGAAGLCDRENEGESESERTGARNAHSHSHMLTPLRWQVSTSFTRAKKPRTAT